jgi:hypothetical protein
MGLAFLPMGPVSPPMGPVPAARESQPKGPVPMGPVSQLKAAASHLTEPASAAKGPVSPPVEPESRQKVPVSQPKGLVSQPKGLASRRKVPVFQRTAQPVPLEQGSQPVALRQVPVAPRRALSQAEYPPSSSQGPHQKMRLPAAAVGCRSSSAGRR